MDEPVTDLLQARVGAERVAAVKTLAKRKGMTMQALVSKLIDEATGVASSHTDVIRPADDGGAVLAELQKQTALLEQLVGGGRPDQQLTENPVNSLVSPALIEGSGEIPPVSAVPAVAVDGEQLVAGVRAKSKEELEEWLNLPESEEMKAVVITPSPALVEQPVKRKGSPAFAAALREAAAAVVGDQVDQDAEHVPVHVPEQLSGSAVDSAVDVEVSTDQQGERVQAGVDVTPGAVAQIRVWRQEQVGLEAPTAPPVSSAAEWVLSARDALKDLGMAGDLGEVTALLQLWQCPHDLLAGETSELLAELPNYERL